MLTHSVSQLKVERSGGGAVPTLASLDEMAERLQDVVGRLADQILDGPDAARLVRAFTRLERLAGAGRSIAARRVVETGAWRAEGHRSPGDWLAETTKTSPAAATAALATMERLDDLPATRAAFTAGRLSSEQAVEIAAAAHVDPAAEAALLHTATSSTLGTLRKTAHAVRAAAEASQLADRERAHRTRYFRHWTTADGAFEARCRLTVDHGALLVAALDVEHRLLFEHARAQGRHESPEAYQADALVNLARNTLGALGPATPAPPRPSDPAAVGNSPALPGMGAGLLPATADPGRPEPCRRPTPAGTPTALPAVGASVPPSSASSSGNTTPATAGDRPLRGGDPPRRLRLVPTVTVRVDHRALVRGRTGPGEVCEIAGVGPIPVETARAYLRGDAVIRALLVDGERVIDARSAGRTIPARLRAALEERDRTCVVPGCDAARHLEIHHLDPYALSADTSLTNTARVCPYHHDQITYGDATLAGEPGNWRWQPATSPDPDHGPFDDLGIADSQPAGRRHGTAVALAASTGPAPP